jgi:hypothetical protein
MRIITNAQDDVDPSLLDQLRKVEDLEARPLLTGESVGRRGLDVACLPGLVRTSLWHHGDSTWDNPNLPDRSLGSRGTP